MLFERGAARLKLRPFFRSDRTHFRIGGRVFDQAGDAFELALRHAIGFDRLHDRCEFREFARELHVVFSRHGGGKLAFQRRVAGQESIKFLIGQHGC